MAKLSSSMLRSAAASAREKNAENAVVATVRQPEAAEEKPEPVKKEASKAESKRKPRKASQPKQEAAPLVAKGVLHADEGERKTEHVNLLITPTLSKKIETIQIQGGFRSKNAAVIAVLEAFCEANDIE